MTDDEAKKVLHKLSGRYFVGDRVRLFSISGWSVEGLVLNTIDGEITRLSPDWKTKRGYSDNGYGHDPLFVLTTDTFEFVSDSESRAK